MIRHMQLVLFCINPEFNPAGQGALGVVLVVAVLVFYGQLTMCMPCFLTIAEKNRSGIQTFITVCCWDKEFMICVPSLVLGKVRSAVGSAQLLISQKFQQFRGLCEQNLVRIKPFCNAPTLQVCTGVKLRLESSVPNSGVCRHNNVYASQQTQTHNNKIHIDKREIQLITADVWNLKNTKDKKVKSNSNRAMQDSNATRGIKYSVTKNWN